MAAQDLSKEPSVASCDDKDLELQRQENVARLCRHSLTEFERHGTWLTATFHVITAVIGAGVLSLSYAISWLGWVAGPLFILVFAYITLHTAQILADMYLVNGKRHRTYKAAVKSVFGRRGGVAIAWIQYVNLILTAVAYNITGSTSIQTIVRNECVHNGTPMDECWDDYWKFAAMFAGAQLFFSQLPNLDSAWWASAIGALMSFGYSFIALGLSIAEGNHHGTIGGRTASAADKAFGMFNALGAIVFAFSFAFLLLEIEDTIQDRPGMSAPKAMKRAVNVSLVVVTSFFLAVGIAGYMAFGDSVSSNIITNFTSPLWLIQLANAMVLVHMFPAYQVFSQPVFMAAESWIEKRPWARDTRTFFITTRLTVRSLYVFVVGMVALCIPFFGDFVGLIGALGFWPATIFFPVEMYIRTYTVSRKVKVLLQSISVFSLIVTILAIIGSIQQIVEDASSYSFFS